MANYTMHHLVVGSDTYEMVDEQGRANIAPSFSTSTAYAAGDYVIYGGKLYQFTSAHSGAWTGTDAEETTVSKDTSQLKEDLNQAIEDFAVPTQEAVDNWLNAHPEATTTVQDGTITTEKLSSNLKHKVDSMASFSITRYVTLDNAAFQGDLYYLDWKSLQSVAYNSTDDVYALLYSDGNNVGDCLIVLIDDEFNYISRKTISPQLVGHCNDITYCEDNNEYVIATQGSGELCVIDASTLEYITTVTLTGVGNTVQVSYDSTNAFFYVTDMSRNLFKVSRDYSNIKRIATISVSDFSVPYDGITSQYIQGSCVYKGRFVSSWWIGGSELSYYRLLIFSEDGTTVVNCCDYIASSLYDEAEGLTVSRDDDLFCFGYQGANIYVYCLNDKAQFVNYIYPLNLKRYTYTSNNTALLEDIHVTNPSPSYYQAFIHFSAVHQKLGGTDGLLTGFVSIDNYGWQRFMSPVLSATRTYINGTWNNWTIDTLGYSVTSILNEVGESYSQINTSDSRIICCIKDGQTMIDFKFKCSSAISSGTVTLPSSIASSLTEIHTALASADGKSGFAQYNGRTLVIRCQASSANYLCGQLVFPS